MTSPKRLLVAPAAAPVLTPEAVTEIGHKILRMATLDATRVELVHTARAVSRVLDNRIRSGNDGDKLKLHIYTRSGMRNTCEITTNQIDEATLRAHLRLGEELARQQYGGLQDLVVPAGPRQFMPVSLYHESTVDAYQETRNAVLPQVMGALADAKLKGAAFIGVMVRTTCVMDQSGLATTCEETDAEVTVSALSTDSATGAWAGQAARDWTKIDAEAIAHEAISVAQRSTNPVAVEPGHRTAILGPAAVLQLLRHVNKAFDYKAVIFGRSPFFDPPNGNKIGKHVFDERIAMSSDPNDPDGGYPPFFQPHWGEGFTGFPIAPVNWVTGGVLQTLAYDPEWVAKLGRVGAHPDPVAMRVSGGPTSVAEMIASCKEGIYVNRFANVSLVDERTGVVTGTTQGGCFVVKDGKLTQPIKNFRFVESPWFVLNKLEAIGPTARAACGYIAGDDDEPWPHAPMIVPPIMVRDFNFTSLADAI